MSNLKPVNRQFYSLPKSSDSESDHGSSEKNIIPSNFDGGGYDDDGNTGAFVVSGSASSGLTKHSSIIPKNDDQDLLAYIRNNVIGSIKVFSGPFGLRTGRL